MVVRQRCRVQKLKDVRGNTDMALALLDQFEDLQREHETHLARLEDSDRSICQVREKPLTRSQLSQRQPECRDVRCAR
jgi:hypothetical protein